ncbi:hypothetical protein [Klenkia terrae]|uniref:GAF domain-containing protein n=1 Tax=Klenkia terrae TaxID=1052259 RepID=A0ABU8E421_9ACTN|nr:hypothetical protein [Klenkia terrae]SSC24059.1 GAF-like domain superfamily protein [Klenkia terrae]
MTAASRFTEVLARLVGEPDRDDLLPDQVAAACVAALPVDGASLSYTLLPDRRLPLGASDLQAAAAERLQYATGEGPCLTAQQIRGVVVAPLEELKGGWPLFAVQLVAHTPYRCVVALPVGGALAGVAALDLYLRDPGTPTAGTLADVAAVAELVGEVLADDLAGEEDIVLGLPRSFRALPIVERHRVWLAVGHISGQRALTTSDALSLLRGAAFTLGLDLETTANRVLSGELVIPDLGGPPSS